MLKKKIILWFLIFSLLISYIFPIISFGKYNNYISLGDSIPDGYYLENPDADNYGEKLRQKLNISSDNFENLSISGETALNFYKTIQTEKYTTAIKNSDLITITIGSNEMLEVLFQAYGYALGIPMDEYNIEYVNSILNALSNANLFETIDIYLKVYEYITTEDINGKVETNIKRYEEYWKKSLDYIKKINPNATIVATEFYNPYYDITLLNYDIGGWCDEIIQKLNTLLYSYSKSETEYKIAKIYSTFNTASPRLTNVNLSLSNFDVDPHPTVLGHELISLKILEELSANDTTQNKKDISTLAITDIIDQEYTGSPITPSIFIKDGNYTLVEDKDYSIIYHNNTNIGQATAFIVGIGKYTGKTTKTFNIKNGNEKNIAVCTVQPVEYQLFLGINLEPEVIILDGNKTLVKNTDYTLKYHNNINAGIGTITITGIGNYTGSTTTNFIIAPMDVGMTTVHDIPNQLYTGKEVKPDIIISFGAVKLIEGVDYSLKYENNVNIGTSTVTITGKGNYSGTTVKKFKIVDSINSNLQDISKATIEKITSKTYTGSSLTPELKITLNGKTLSSNTDYKIFYSNNIDVGTGIATVVGIGDYTGTIETTFKIVEKDIENLNLEDIPDKEYTGKKIKPKLNITNNSKKLIEYTDYTVTYYNNIDIGVATVQIQGIGNYTGTLFKTFNIVEPTPEPPAEDKNDDIQSIPGDAMNNSASSNSPSDDTTSNNSIPHAGTNLIYFILIISFIGLSITFYKLSKKWY